MTNANETARQWAMNHAGEGSAHRRRGPHVEIMDWRDTGKQHRLEADTVLEAIEAAEAWLREEGLIP